MILVEYSQEYPQDSYPLGYHRDILGIAIPGILLEYPGDIPRYILGLSLGYFREYSEIIPGISPGYP